MEGGELLRKKSKGLLSFLEFKFVLFYTCFWNILRKRNVATVQRHSSSVDLSAAADLVKYLIAASWPISRETKTKQMHLQALCSPRQKCKVRIVTLTHCYPNNESVGPSKTHPPFQFCLQLMKRLVIAPKCTD